MSQGPVDDTPPIFADEGVRLGRKCGARIASVAALGGLLLFGYDSAVINGAVSSIQAHFGIDDQWGSPSPPRCSVLPSAP